MLNIIDLEKRWMRYKIKSYLPHISIFISSIIIVSIILIYSKDMTKTEILIKQSIPIIGLEEVRKVKMSAPIITPKSIIKVETKALSSKNNVTLTPSLDFIRKMQSSLQPYYKDNRLKIPVTTHQVKAPIIETVKQKQVIIPKYAPKEKSKKITIKRQNTQNDIHEIIKRFKKNNNPALSLFVAKKYYELGDYQQAYNYALITNKINQDIESSWIIFSKSLLKLGKRDKAIKTLTKYIEQSHSSSARILLDEIYTGKFR